MQITLTRLNERTKKPTYTVADFHAILNAIQTGWFQSQVDGLRATVESTGNEQDYYRYDRILRVIPAAKLRKRGTDEPAMLSYTGIICLKVEHVAEPSVQRLVKEDAMLLPQTMAAFVGGNGSSVIILTRAELPDQKLPQGQTAVELFHQKAYRTAVMCYTPVLRRAITIEAARIGASFLISSDPAMLTNSHAVPFIITQPTQGEVQRLMDGRLPVNRMAAPADRPGFVSMHQVFAACVTRACRSSSREVWLVPQAAIIAVAQECQQCGMPEEEATRQLLWRFRKVDEQDVRCTVRSIYEEAIPQPELDPMMPKKQIASIRLREFFGRRYELRRNTVLQTIEYRIRYSLDFRFHELTKFDRNTMKYEAAMEGIEAFDSEINGYIDSNYTPVYDPIAEFVDNLGTWDGKDHIGLLSQMVTTDHPSWDLLFRRWFLCMVAHWMDIDREHANSTAPILVGAQGFRKSTFCRILLPPELRCFYTDSLDLRSKQEAERYLSRFLLVNIDEFDQLSEQQFSFVKHLFQKPQVSMRRMHSQSIVQQSRYASFIGTSNHQDILRDTTGNRRYLCVNVTAPIRTETPIDYGQLYAQAVTLIRQGERYWLDDEDERLLMVANRDFEVQIPQELILTDMFEPAMEGEDDAELLKLTDILVALSKHKAFDRKSMNNLRTLGHLMRKLTFREQKKRDGIYYWVKRTQKK